VIFDIAVERLLQGDAAHRGDAVGRQLQPHLGPGDLAGAVHRQVLEQFRLIATLLTLKQLLAQPLCSIYGDEVQLLLPCPFPRRLSRFSGDLYDYLVP